MNLHHTPMSNPSEAPFSRESTHVVVANSVDGATEADDCIGHSHAAARNSRNEIDEHIKKRNTPTGEYAGVVGKPMAT